MTEIDKGIDHDAAQPILDLGKEMVAAFYVAYNHPASEDTEQSRPATPRASDTVLVDDLPAPW